MCRPRWRRSGRRPAPRRAALLRAALLPTAGSVRSAGARTGRGPVGVSVVPPGLRHGGHLAGGHRVGLADLGRRVRIGVSLGAPRFGGAVRPLDGIRAAGGVRAGRSSGVAVRRGAGVLGGRVRPSPPRLVRSHRVPPCEKGRADPRLGPPDLIGSGAAASWPCHLALDVAAPEVVVTLAVRATPASIPFPLPKPVWSRPDTAREVAGRAAGPR